ncbi:hypothetical protein [Streptomyces sp. NPDC005970]|uniref:ABC transporter substrate-binding protein n=1 Tax=Streptomyces sp. NPDC005970 TaxID=3156723 RepID=UPI0033D92916
MFSSVPPLPKVNSFVEALEQLIKQPPKRRGPAPQVLLTQLSDGTEAERIADGLCGRFSAGGRARIPYAQVAGAPSGPRREGVGDTFQKIEEELLRNRPSGFGRLRLSQYHLMCSIVEAQLTEGQPLVQAEELRNKCYEARCKDSRILRALEAVSGGEEPPPSIPATAWYWLRRPLLGLLPRWWYGWRNGRRMTRKGSWYRLWAELPERGADFFADARRLAGADGSSGLDQTVAVLLRALLADLQAACRHPLLSPWGRRRKHRFVLVFPQVEPAEPQVGQLLAQFPDAVEQTGCTGVLLVAAVPPDGGSTESYAEAAVTLNSWRVAAGVGRARVVRVGVEPSADDADAARWLSRFPEIYLEKTHSDLAPRLEAALASVAGATTLALLATYGLTWLLPEGDKTDCLTRTAATESAAPSGTGRIPSGKSPKELYRAVRAMIERQNEEADAAAARPGAMVRTVVYLGVPVTVNSWKEAMYSGAIPELRGIALAQEELNREASRDEGNKVWLRVRVEDAGERFTKAPAVAAEIVRELKREKGDEQIMGVVGLGQSRKDTLRARDILGEGGLPVIGTVATAEEMQRHPMYRQVAPDNRREARIAADFARRGNIVQTAPGKCAPAERAVVIADPTDNYSANLSERFTEEFRDTHRIWYTAGGDRMSHHPAQEDGVEWVQKFSEMAEKVCRRLKDEPRTVVYWTARANEFGAFLDEFNSGTECNGQLTALGGNDLTNAVVDEQRPSERYPRLRLYYAAHALPKSYPPNVMGENFRRQYVATYGSRDPWSNDGRTPLASDALRVLATALNEARQDAGTAAFGRGTVQAALVNGAGGAAGVRGASGTLAFGRDGKVPTAKRLLILHDTKRGPEVALECGARDNGDERKTWGPDNEFACPGD